MLGRILKKALPVLWLIPGFLLWASFPPMGERIDALFALAPLLWLSRRKDARTSFWKWFQNGFLFWFATLAWMPAIVKNGGPWPLVVLGWGALSAYCALFFAAFGWLSAKYWTWVRGDPLGTALERRRGYGWRLLGLVVVEPVLWAGFELLRSRLFGGFAWNQLGVAVVNAGIGAPVVLGGVYLASALVVLVNGTVASIAERMLEPILDRGLAAPFAVPRWARSVETLLPFLIVWGVFKAADLFVVQPAAESSGNLRVAMVQRNFPSVFERGREEDPVSAYTDLLAAVEHAKPGLVVLPESALCEFGAADSPRSAAFAKWVCDKTGATAVIAGGGRRSGGKEYNSAMLYTHSPFPVPQIYDKVHLVPFGEYIPGDKLVTALQRLAPVGSCTPGELKLLDMDGIGIGVAICFEDTDSAQIRRLAEMGAQLLVFITNDSWFSRSDEAVQHAWQSVARSIETGLPVVRVGNSGVTGSISPDGSATWLADAEGRPLVDVAATMCDQLTAIPRRPTPYVRLGDKPLAAAFASVLALVWFAAFRRRRRLAEGAPYPKGEGGVPC